MLNFSTILITTPVFDQAGALYEGLLGRPASVDSPQYVGFDCDGQHVGIRPGSPGVRAHLHVTDLEGAIDLVGRHGGSVVEAPSHVGGGRSVAVVRDAGGAEIGLICDHQATPDQVTRS